MSALYDEFAAQLERWRRDLGHRPGEQMLRLCLLALEREELVAVAYRQSVLRHRLERSALPPRVSEAIAHALLGIWRDEEMHTVYLRGALLRLSSRATRLATVAQLSSGAIGGWATSILQHVRGRDQPLPWLAARLVTWLGLVAGKVPAAVRGELEHRPLRDYCLYNLEAERTAALGFARMGELLDPARDGLAPAEVEQMQSDEQRHARIFALIAEHFDGEDRYLPDDSGVKLESALRSIGEVFVAPHRRSEAREPKASAEVHIVSNGADGGAGAALDELLDRVDLERLVRERLSRSRPDGAPPSACIKTSFMLGYSRGDRSPIVVPERVEQLATRLGAAGIENVTVIETPNLYDRFFGRRAVAEVAAHFGFRSERYRVVDSATDLVEHRYARGMTLRTVSRSWRDADLRVSLGKMRSHPTDICYLTIANLEGVAMRHDQHLFVERQVHRETAILMLLAELPPDLAILDAWDELPDGLAGVMGTRRPLAPHRFYASRDALALDLVAARHMGADPLAECGFLRGAVEWFGDPTTTTQVAGRDVPIGEWHGPHGTQAASLLAAFAYPVFVFASGRGALFVPPMDPTAFPPHTSPSLFLRAGRRAIRELLRLRTAP